MTDKEPVPVAGNGLLDRRFFLRTGLAGGAMLLSAKAPGAEREPWMNSPGVGLSELGLPSDHEAHVERIGINTPNRYHRRRCIADSARAPGRHHYAEPSALRATSQRNSPDRPGSASFDRAWAGRTSTVLRSRQSRPLSDDIEHPIPRMLRKQFHIARPYTTPKDVRRVTRSDLCKRVGWGAAFHTA